MTNDNEEFMTKQEFTKFYFETLCKKVKDITLIEMNELEIKMKKDDNNYIHNLQNSYSEYVSDPTNLNEITDRYTTSSKELYEPRNEIILDRIVPVVRDYRFYNEVRQLFQNSDDINAHEKYNEDLYIFYAEDTDNGISYIKESDLNKLPIERENLLSIAIENLWSVIENIERHGDSSIYMITAGGNYESSLLLTDIWTNENFPVDGDFIIGVPARDLLFVTGSNDKKGIEIMKERIIDINNSGDHIVSEKLFRLKNSKFEVWEG